LPFESCASHVSFAMVPDRWPPIMASPRRRIHDCAIPLSRKAAGDGGRIATN
jgi:hypothetical protein